MPIDDSASAPPTPPAGDDRGAWRRLIRMGGPRPTRANLLALCLALLLGFAIATQVRQTRSQGLETLREQDLVGILDTVTQEGVRLGVQLRELERTQDRLASGADSEAAALALTKSRADSLAILAGTVPAQGPGIKMTITDPQGKVGATLLLDTLQELRDAGAEVVQIGDVRVVAQTFFTESDGAVSVSGTSVSAPYTFLVIGDAQTLSSAMGIPGGVQESVRTAGGEVTIVPVESVQITAVVTPSTPRFAEPVPSPSPTSG